MTGELKATIAELRQEWMLMESLTGTGLVLEHGDALYQFRQSARQHLTAILDALEQQAGEIAELKEQRRVEALEADKDDAEIKRLTEALATAEGAWGDAEKCKDDLKTALREELETVKAALTEAAQWEDGITHRDAEIERLKTALAEAEKDADDIIAGELAHANQQIATLRARLAEYEKRPRLCENGTHEIAEDGECCNCALKVRLPTERLEKAEADTRRPAEIVEQIMSMHWDLAACLCWICKEGRAAGCRPREEYHGWRGTLGYVDQPCAPAKESGK